MSRSVARALEAFESALRHAPLEGLRDLHEALQTGQLANPYDGKADLVRGRWGTLGTGVAAERFSACPLNALYVRWARECGGNLLNVIDALTVEMARDGFGPADFYAAWDRGDLSRLELRRRVERHLEARLEAEAVSR